MFTRMIGVVYLIFEGLVFVSFFSHQFMFHVSAIRLLTFLGVRDCWRHVLHAGKSADGWMVMFFMPLIQGDGQGTNKIVKLS